jgi:hypothetical protein
MQPLRQGAPLRLCVSLRLREPDGDTSDWPHATLLRKLERIEALKPSMDGNFLSTVD